MDVETTGGSAIYHRVIEIGVLVVQDGAIVERYEQLIYPRGLVPDFISGITGITNADLDGAPLFEDIAEDLHKRLAGCVFVAHNARFDYGFLKNEFSRCGITFKADCLCTVKLSRRLFPEQERHNLDTIIERWGIAADRRHRALDDALVLFEFLKKVEERVGKDRLDLALAAL